MTKAEKNLYVDELVREFLGRYPDWKLSVTDKGLISRYCLKEISERKDLIWIASFSISPGLDRLNARIGWCESLEKYIASIGTPNNAAMLRQEGTLSRIRQTGVAREFSYTCFTTHLSSLIKNGFAGVEITHENAGRARQEVLNQVEEYGIPYLKLAGLSMLGSESLLCNQADAGTGSSLKTCLAAGAAYCGVRSHIRGAA